MKKLKRFFTFCALGISIAITVFAVGMFFPWILLTVAAFVALGFVIYPIRRAWSFRRDGYFVTMSREHPVIYEEKRGDQLLSLPIPTLLVEYGRNHVDIPSRKTWLASAPDWARERRDEIFQRVIAHRPKGWVEYPDDWEAARDGDEASFRLHIPPIL